MPAAMRPAVRAVYAFARSADDFADNGTLPAEERLALLQAYVDDLDRIAAGHDCALPVLRTLAAVISEHALPLQPFRDLLSAFQQDVVVHSYASRAAVLDYCRRSADPVGRIMLALWRRQEPELQVASDAICTALQLINFLQDIAIDSRIPRIYIADEVLQQFDLSHADLLQRPLACQTPLRALVLSECAWTRRHMLRGASLPAALGGRIGLELALVVAGGLRILDKIEAVEGDVWQRRPRLAGLDWPRLAWRAWIRGFAVGQTHAAGTGR